METITRLFVIGVVIDTAGIVGLGIWDFAVTGQVSAYTAFIVGLIVYSLTSAAATPSTSTHGWPGASRANGVKPVAIGRPCPDRP